MPKTLTHPRIAATPESLDRARKRVSTEKWAMSILKSLQSSVPELIEMGFPVFEKQWWKRARKQHWSQTYPEINQHTGFAVRDHGKKCQHTALYWALTGDSEALEITKQMLLHFTGYEFFAKHPDVGLNFSTWLIPLLCAYDLTYAEFSSQEREKLDDFFERGRIAVEKDDKWWVRENPGGIFNNHFAWHKLTQGAMGLFYGREELVDYALYSDQGIKGLIEYGTLDDGLWFESSLNYHFTAVAAIALMAQFLRNAGHPTDLWTQPFANGRSVADFYRAPIGITLPDLTQPTIGDCYGHRMSLPTGETFWDAYGASKDGTIGWLLLRCKSRPSQALFVDELPDPKLPAPERRTRIWPEHGYLELISQEGQDFWKGEGFTAFLSFDVDGIHSHHDKFDMIVYGCGKHLSTDPETLPTAKHAFSSKAQSELNRSTICHNSVMVDGNEQGSLVDKLDVIQFVNNHDLKMATAADTRGRVYPGVAMQRTVAVTDEFVLDIFQVASDQRHTYDYLFHSLSDSGGFETDLGLVPFKLPSSNPWKWLRNAQSAEVTEDWSLSARQDDVEMRLTFAPASRTRVIICDFPARDDFSAFHPMIIVRRKAKNTVFASVMTAAGKSAPKPILNVTKEKHGLLRASVEVNGTSREVVTKRLF